MTCKNTINRINLYGKKGIPFLFIIDFGMKKPLALPLDKINPSEISYKVRGITNAPEEALKSTPFNFGKFPVRFDEYLRAFEKVKKNIDLGNSYLLNLTFPTRISTNLDLKEIFSYSKAAFKLRYRDDFVVFSPEAFVSIKNGMIFSYPMKGTRDASEDNAEEKLMKDEKEIAEHHTIVDLIRNDLSMVSGNVEVKRFRYTEKILTNEKTLLQTSSEICGRLDDGWPARLGDLLFSLLPAGSVTGAPKKKTVEIIRNVETYERGYFTGIFGLFDGAGLESAVMIRFIEKKGNVMIFKSGGGITCFSNPQNEYNEMVDKVYLPFCK
ncbi:MAG: aminodeoxychorismate synthase component I [Bacteroidales bacterium]|nr:aminodeoxychorismate synthase component I [Bacteroidales bacterium]